MDSNSAMGFKIGKDTANAEKIEQKEEVNSKPPVEGISTINGADGDIDSNGEYTDRRTITIMLTKNYSLYRKANDKVLPKRRDYIGSSVNSSRILSANKKEVETYFPNIIGLSSNDPNFVSRVKQYLNNIRVPVDELGRSFDISFHYYHKSDYKKIKAEEDKIEERYQSANKQSLSALKEALKDKINRIIDVETKKCSLGYPINVEEYLIYRHCLIYNDVAKDIALINSDPSIRFYFKDNKKEEDKKRKYRIEVNKAKANYVTALANDEIFDAIYIQYCVTNNLPVASSIAENRLDKEIKLDKFSTDEPVKFNKIFNDKDLKLISTIELLISRGELVRSQYNQNISTVDGDFIGSNMKEAVIWFKNPDNSSFVNALINKLNNI